MMRNSTLRLLSKVMCLVLIASFVLEAPLFAAFDAIKVNVGGQQVQVTPGQWVTVRQGSSVVNYNVRYVNGQPVALDMAQYMRLVLPTVGADAATANVGQAAQAATTGQAAAPVVKTGTTAAQTVVAGNAQADTSAVAAAQSGAKTDSWIKTELKDYGSKIKDSFSSGKTSGQEFGTKTVDTVKTGAGKVGTGVKSVGSKIGDLLRGAKERISKIFHKNPTPAKGSADSAQSGQSGQSSEQSGQSGQSSEQSGQSGQSGQASEQSGQSGQSSEQSGQSGQASEQTGQTGQSSEQSGQSGQASEQTGQAAQSGKADKPGFKEVTSNKFKAGYDKGKVMVGQGVQNVKDSLKSGFSPKNLLVTAGITVGVDLATQIIRGEKPSLKKAVKVVASAEFAGGVVGSVTGAAAGSFFVPFLSAVPVVGGFLSALAPTFGSVVGGSVGSYLAGDLKNGKFSLKQAFKQIDWIGVAGQSVGSTVGAMLGSAIFPPFGTIIGGMVGGFVGNWAAKKIAGLFGHKVDNNSTVALPVGTNPIGETAVTGSVTIGNAGAGSEIPVSGDQSTAQVTISGDAESVGTYASEVQLAYAKYQELYRLYNEMLAQGRQDDAMKVAQEMNKAKGEYEALKANSGN